MTSTGPVLLLIAMAVFTAAVLVIGTLFASGTLPRERTRPRAPEEVGPVASRPPDE